MCSENIILWIYLKIFSTFICLSGLKKIVLSINVWNTYFIIMDYLNMKITNQTRGKIILFHKLININTLIYYLHISLKCNAINPRNFIIYS